MSNVRPFRAVQLVLANLELKRLVAEGKVGMIFKNSSCMVGWCAICESVLCQQLEVPAQAVGNTTRRGCMSYFLILQFATRARVITMIVIAFRAVHARW